MEQKTVIFLFFWNLFTLSQRIYTSVTTGATDKYQVCRLLTWHLEVNTEYWKILLVMVTSLHHIRFAFICPRYGCYGSICHNSSMAWSCCMWQGCEQFFDLRMRFSGAVESIWRWHRGQSGGWSPSPSSWEKVGWKPAFLSTLRIWRRLLSVGEECISINDQLEKNTSINLF